MTKAPSARSFALPWYLLAFPLAFGVFFLTIGSVPAAPVPYGNAVAYDDITVAVEPPPSPKNLHGYTEYWVLVTNKSKTPHRVTLSTPEQGYHPRGDHISEISRTLEVGPLSSVRVFLMQPSHPVATGGGLSVRIDGRLQEQGAPLSLSQSNPPGSYSYYRGSPHYYASTPHMEEPHVLISRGVHTNFQHEVSTNLSPAPAIGPGATPPGGAFGGPGVIPPPGAPFAPPPGGRAMKPSAGPGWMRYNVQFARSEVPAAGWSPNWLGYSRYDGVVVTGDEMRSMPAAVQTALWQYTECGGSLLILGAWPVPESWHRPEQDTDGFTLYSPGLGQCLVSADDDFGRWEPERWQRLASAWTQGPAPWEQIQDVMPANAEFPVVQDIGIPVRSLFLLVLVFALGIGPLNLVVLSRLKRRIWLLWTVPAISLLTCVAVFGFMILVEGWEGHARAEGLTILDETAHRATTVGRLGFYTPLTPGGGLHFSYDTEVVPQIVGEWRQAGSARTIDWTHDQHLSSGWVTARIPAHFTIRKSEVRRERVTINKAADGTLSLVNGLGAGIREFRYADESKRIYMARDVAAGGQAALSPTGESLDDKLLVPSLRQILGSGWITNVQKLSHDPRSVLRPRCYLAVLDSSPFIEEGLKARTRQSSSVVLGIMNKAGATPGDES